MGGATPARGRVNVVVQDDGIAVGAAAPNIEIFGPDGQSVRLESFRGQPVVLAFSAVWDPAWPEQISHYASALDRVQLVGISCEGHLCRLRTEEGSEEFPVLHGSPDGGDAARAFGVRSGQAVFVIDGDGIVRWKHIARAGMHPSAKVVHQALKPYASGAFSRRQFLATAVAASLALAILPSLARASRAGETKQEGSTQAGSKTVTLNVNGEDHQVAVDSRTTLLDALRERMGLVGTKKGCEHGQCGACTVHMDGRRVNSCLVLALQAEGSKITTVEGLAHGGKLHPVQEAFIKHDGFQCGYCTPGQVMSAVACIAEGHTGSDDEIREWMSGNICRCGAYNGILAAVKEAAGK